MTQRDEFEKKVRNILNGIVRDCQDMDSKIELVNLTIKQASLEVEYLYTLRFRECLGEKDKYSQNECDRVRAYKRGRNLKIDTATRKWEGK